MARSCLLALALCGELIALPVIACGPFFLILLHDRAATLAAPIGIHTGPTLLATAGIHFPGERTRPRTDRTSAERQGLPSAAQAALTAARAARDGQSAFAEAHDLPDAARLYVAAAVDFQYARPGVACNTTAPRPVEIAAPDGACPLPPELHRLMRRAHDRFQRILSLPPRENSDRAVWAAYMLGRSETWLGQSQKAIQAFRLSRRLALRGKPDPLSLAVASLGDEARLALRAGHYARAVHLYAEQEAHGMQGAQDSLTVTAERLLALPEPELALQLKDPLTLKLATDHALQLASDTVREHELNGGGNDKIQSLLGTLVSLLPRLDLARQSAALDRLAAVAYDGGNFDMAEKLSAPLDTPLAHWVRAKLALRQGDAPLAAMHYARAIQAFTDLDAWPGMRVRGEGGVLSMQRGEYQQALSQFLSAGDRYLIDAGYVADRVLTTDELKSFVDRNPDLAHAIRPILARRLMRDRRFGEAENFFGPELQPVAHSYAQALADADNAWTATHRAKSLYAAARLLKEHGLELMGTELSPDTARFGGEFDLANPLPKTDSRQDRAERERVQNAAPQPDVRWHYRSMAAELARQAAQALPPRSQASAALLCIATGWVLNSDPPRAAAIYRQYLREGPYAVWAAQFGKHCPEPDFDKPFRVWVHRNALHAWMPHDWKRVERRICTHRILLAALIIGLLWAIGRIWRTRP
jgi:hypothetical protein